MRAFPGRAGQRGDLRILGGRQIEKVQAYTQTQLSNLKEWWSFADPATRWKDTGRTILAGPGDTCAYLDNKAGIVAYDYQMGSSSRRPTIAANVLNGNAGALFSADDVMESLNGYTWTGGGFWWLVVKTVLLTSAYQRYVSQRTGTDSDFNQANGVIVLRGQSGDNRWIMQANALAADTLSCVNPANSVDGTAYYLRGYVNGGNASMTITGLGTVTDTYTNIDPTPTWRTLGAQRIALPNYQEFTEAYLIEGGVAVGPQSASLMAAHDALMFTTYGTS